MNDYAETIKRLGGGHAAAITHAISNLIIARIAAARCGIAITDLHKAEKELAESIAAGLHAATYNQ